MKRIVTNVEYEAIMTRVNEYLTGKSEPTLQIARRIQKQLNIDANVILGII